MNRTLVAATAVVALLIAACSDDDDAADSTTPATTEPVETTASATIDPPDTTPPPTEPPDTTTTQPPTTTIDEDALKAEIAADWRRSWDLRTELTENPTLDNLDAALAEISAPDSENYNTLEDFITGMVERGEHVQRGEPDFFRTDIEGVELIGSPPYTEAVVTICYVSNRVRVDAEGNVLPDTGPLVAARREDKVSATANGWLPTGGFVDLWQGLDVTECPPA